jgi:nucleosome assembly protein 1-like 1
MVVLEALKAVELEETALNNQMELEKLVLDKKYADLKAPLYSRRKSLVTGRAKPTMDEIRVGGEVFKLADPSYEPYSSKFKAIPRELGVPEFWLTAIQNHQNLSPLVEENDEEALMFLIDIALEYTSEDVQRSGATYSAVAAGPAGKYSDGRNRSSRGSGASSSSPSSSGVDVKPGFKLLFHFCENPFFYNEVLEKEYIYKTNDAPYSGGGFVFSHANGTIIQWKSSERNLTEIGDAKSFFNFFSPPPSLSESQIDQSGQVDHSEELEELFDAMDSDLQAGEDFKDDIVPRALEYFIDPPEWDEEDYGEDDDDDDDDY